MAITKIRERAYVDDSPASKGAAILAALAFFGLSVLTRWKIIGKIVNLLGNVLTVGYIALAIYLWTCGGAAPVPEETPVSETPAAE